MPLDQEEDGGETTDLELPPVTTPSRKPRPSRRKSIKNEIYAQTKTSAQGYFSTRFDKFGPNLVTLRSICSKSTPIAFSTPL